MSSELEMMLYEPSAVLPAQISGGVRWDADTSGPRALMLAVLEDAVGCLEGGRWRRSFQTRRLAAEAEAWVRCDRGDWPCSFVNICEVLGLEPDAVRVRLLPSQRDAAASGSTACRASSKRGGRCGDGLSGTTRRCDQSGNEQRRSRRYVHGSSNGAGSARRASEGRVPRRGLGGTDEEAVRARRTSEPASTFPIDALPLRPPAARRPRHLIRSSDRPRTGSASGMSGRA